MVVLFHRTSYARPSPGIPYDDITAELLPIIQKTLDPGPHPLRFEESCSG